VIDITGGQHQKTVLHACFFAQKTPHQSKHNKIHIIKTKSKRK